MAASTETAPPAPVVRPLLLRHAALLVGGSMLLVAGGIGWALGGGWGKRVIAGGVAVDRGSDTVHLVIRELFGHADAVRGVRHLAQGVTLEPMALEQAEQRSERVVTLPFRDRRARST